MLKKIQRATASSPEGTRGLVRGVLACAAQNIAFMLPTSLLYALVRDLMAGGAAGRTAFYVCGCVACFALILLTTWFQYNGTYFTTYQESGIRRLTLAERLRRLPLSFFGKRDLADLTSTIMADCEVLEKTCSHFIPGLFGSLISTVLIALGLFLFDWRMALAALWVIPVSAAIVLCSYRVQDRVQSRTMAVKMTCADGIQEYIESIRDLKASNAEQGYLGGLSRKIRAVEKQTIAAELTNAVFVTSAGTVLKLGIASVALTGSVLLLSGRIDVLTLFLFGVPNMVEHRLDIELPNTLEIIILLFIYAAEILGEINAYYVTFPYWDTVLHTLNGFLCAAIGFSLLDILNREEKIGFSLSPLYLAIVAFCFSMTVGVIWEFFECTMDQLFLLDMQKDTVVNTIGSVMLDPTGGNHPGVIRNITDVIVVQSDGTQTALGLGGYLDIGLLDTMEDLFVNFIGAFTFSIIGYFYVRSRGKNKFAKRFIPVVNEEPQPQTKNTSAGDAPETEKTKE